MIVVISTQSLNASMVPPFSSAARSRLCSARQAEPRLIHACGIADEVERVFGLR